MTACDTGTDGGGLRWEGGYYSVSCIARGIYPCAAWAILAMEIKMRLTLPVRIWPFKRPKSEETEFLNIIIGIRLGRKV
jgi:hypothetical protein